MKKDKKVLIVTNPADPHTDAVIHYLKKLSVEVVRFHVAESHTDSNITITEDHSRVQIHSSNREFSIKEITSVWYRRPDPIDETLSHMPYPDRYLVKNETNATMWGLYGNMDAIWYSHPYNIRIAAWKIYQLSVAREVGFNVPRYCITNDTSSISEFLSQHPEIIIKPIDEKTTFFEEKGISYSLYVKKFKPEQLADLYRSKPISPIYLQKYIQKKYDVRITVIGRKIFTVAIKSAGSEEVVDFRPQTLELEHEIIECPDFLVKQIYKYMEKMGLNFAAFDFILSEDSNWFFLECNPNGQWLWIELKTGLPMVATFAKSLTLDNEHLTDNIQVIK